MKVLVVHTLPPEFNENSRLPAEFDLCESATAVGSALPGTVVCGIAGRPDVLSWAGGFGVVGAYGYLRADIRLDDAGVPHVLDVNPNSSLGMDEGMGRAALEAGWTWRRFIQAQVKWAC